MRGGLPASTRVPRSPLPMTDGAGQMQQKHARGAQMRKSPLLSSSVFVFLKTFVLKHLFAFCLRTKKASVPHDTTCGAFTNEAPWNLPSGLLRVGSTCSGSRNTNVEKHKAEAPSSVIGQGEADPERKAEAHLLATKGT